MQTDNAPVVPMTNGQYQIRRARSDKDSLLAQLRRITVLYARREGATFDSCIRDVLTDLRHLCDIKGLDFGNIDAQAYEGYLEELSWRTEDAGIGAA